MTIPNDSTSTSDGSKIYTLYGLKGDASNPRGRLISPHVWKTKLDSAYLGLSTSIKEEYKTFPQIRNELADLTKNPVVTVPTIHVPIGDGDGDEEGEGKYVTDSWKIAEYLNEKYGTDDKNLFGSGKDGKEFAKFIEIWSNTTFANELRPLIGSVIAGQFDVESKNHMINSMFSSDESRHQSFVDFFKDPTVLENQLSNARKQLSLIESYLSTKGNNDNENENEKEKGLWIIGDSPSHADFCLFGWYATSILHPNVEKGVWRNDELPLVGQWLDGLLNSGLVNQDDLKV